MNQPRITMKAQSRREDEILVLFVHYDCHLMTAISARVQQSAAPKVKQIRAFCAVSAQSQWFLLRNLRGWLSVFTIHDARTSRSFALWALIQSSVCSNGMGRPIPKP